MKYEVITNTDKKTKMAVSKTLITLVLLMVMAVTGLSSYHLFRTSDYNFSALLTYVSYFSIVLGIYALTGHRSPKTIMG